MTGSFLEDQAVLVVKPAIVSVDAGACLVKLVACLLTVN